MLLPILDQMAVEQASAQPAPCPQGVDLPAQNVLHPDMQIERDIAGIKSAEKVVKKGTFVLWANTNEWNVDLFTAMG